MRASFACRTIYVRNRVVKIVFCLLLYRVLIEKIKKIIDKKWPNRVSIKFMSKSEKINSRTFGAIKSRRLLKLNVLSAILPDKPIKSSDV